MSFSGYEIEAPCHVPTPILAGGVEELSEYPTTPVERTDDTRDMYAVYKPRRRRFDVSRKLCSERDFSIHDCMNRPGVVWTSTWQNLQENGTSNK